MIEMGQQTMRIIMLVVLFAFLVSSTHSRSVGRSYYRRRCPDYQYEVEGECYDVSSTKLKALRRTICDLLREIPKGNELEKLCPESEIVPEKGKRFFGHTGFGR